MVRDDFPPVRKILNSYPRDEISPRRAGDRIAGPPSKLCVSLRVARQGKDNRLHGPFSRRSRRPVPEPQAADPEPFLPADPPSWHATLTDWPQKIYDESREGRTRIRGWQAGWFGEGKSSHAARTNILVGGGGRWRRRA